MNSLHLLTGKKITNFFIPITIILNLYGAIIGKQYGIPPQVFTAVSLFLLLGCVCIFHDGIIRLDKNLRTFLLFNILFLVVHLLLFGLGSAEIKYFIYILVFFISLEIANENGWKIIEYVLFGVSLILSLDALRYVPETLAKGIRIYNVTNNTLHDKSVYTLVLTLSVVLLVTRLFEKKENESRLKKCIYLALFVLYSAVNVIVVQSKLFVLVIGITAIILYFLLEGRAKKVIRTFLFLGVFSVIIVFCFLPDIIPDYIYVFLNRYTGMFDKKVSTIQAYNKYMVTYNMRGTIYSFAWGLFLEKPLFGIGFGNYKVYAQQNLELLGGVTQTESSYMNILVEGGLLYTVMHMWILFDLLQKSLRSYKDSNGDMLPLKMLLLVVAYIILNTGNDFYNVMYWLILGFIYRFSRRTVDGKKNNSKGANIS